MTNPNNIFDSYPKLHSLKNILTPLLEGGLIIAFSGGVDSSFLLWSAVEILNQMEADGKQGALKALLVVSPSIPVWEIEEAKQFALNLEANLIIRDGQELLQEAYARNDTFRCYHCKSELFKIAKEEAQKMHGHYIAYGYNASDRKDLRFGHIAATENNIYSPLEQANLEKDEIRTILKQMGMNLADKPASPCLSSRIMTGVRVTDEKLQHIQTMERILRDAGLRLYRVRLHEEHINQSINSSPIKYFRIEVSPEEMSIILQLRNILVETAHKLGYRWVNLDLAGYQMGGGAITA